MLTVQNNLAVSYSELGRLEEAISMRQEVYSGRLKLNGKENEQTLLVALNYASTLFRVERFKEGKALLQKTMPVARRVLGDSHDLSLKMRWNYARALCEDPATTLDDLREAVTMLEDAARIARRVFGASHPLTTGLEYNLRDARAVHDARETPSPGTA